MALFKTKIGLIAATVGSAVGLGNIWRFPAEAQAGGGSAFLLLYVIWVVMLGIPVMSAEFSLGRGGGSDPLGSFKNLQASRGWWFVGGLAILTSYLILCFYTVVAGWTLEYLWASINGWLYKGTSEGNEAMRSMFALKMESLISGTSPYPYIGTVFIILINLVILIGGVQKGIERISNVMMPMLFVILLIFIGFALTLPNAADGLAYFLKPDFSKITPHVALGALGQTFFSLSLGMGILITYSSYYPKDTNLPRTSVTVSLLSVLVAMMMGCIIFPAIMSFSLEGEGVKGATLVFITLPEIFAHVGGTQLWSILFFTLIALAALTSCISIAEVTVAFFHDRMGLSRAKACVATLAPLLLFSTMCVVSINLFDLLDTITNNYLLPIGSTLLCIYMGWFAPKGFFRGQLTNNGLLNRSPWFTSLMIALVRWVCPVLIFLIVVSNFI